ncbi:NmrA family transcriptional regulator [Nonomuraea turkmeniaca]|uniref:NmrA family transcriptional regulator n=1 Tax=Nonomuraea turkmeniaca TaxID=103838 RepID=A0A5S4GD28_9ACTN|nr:NAD(P)H-binding protein [Nonomuraea turkmeniaca]TMR23960.1 NmrA family transcriptional regulator [Nonomuraea turkmeniaca]
MAEHTILVLGATGTTGRRVTGLLRASGHAVLRASRSGETTFDWSRPDTWEPAVAGVSRIYLMAPDGTPVAPEFVSLAVERGVRRIVLLSSGAIEAMGDERLMSAERTVRDSGAEWTVLRPSWFDQNFDEGFLQPAIMAGEVVVPMGEARQAFVDAGDIAAVAAAALTEDGHAGRSYEVTGPRSLTFGEAVEVIARAAGREVRYRGGDEDYLAAMDISEQAMGEVKAFAALRDLGDQPVSETVRQVTGRPPKPFETYATKAAAQGAWRPGGSPP